jgi:hypothetical protein
VRKRSNETRENASFNRNKRYGREGRKEGRKEETVLLSSNITIDGPAQPLPL